MIGGNGGGWMSLIAGDGEFGTRRIGKGGIRRHTSTYHRHDVGCFRC